MTPIFHVYTKRYIKVGPNYESLETARDCHLSFPDMAESLALIKEVSESGQIFYSYWPLPQPLPPATQVPDLTDSVAYSICARSVESTICSSRLDIIELAEKYDSQPHETVLEDHCRDLASEIYGANRYHFHAVVPANPDRALEMERAIVDELCSLAETVLARRLRELAGMYQRAAEHLEQS